MIHTDGKPTIASPENVKHNHLTRDIKGIGICPACDLYWKKQKPEIIKEKDYSLEEERIAWAKRVLYGKPGITDAQVLAKKILGK